MTPAERFWSKVEWSEGCWTWLGAKARAGYGHFWFRGGYPQAHRVAYILAVGPIPDGLVVDHLCRNPICVNPAHLEPVTPRLNVLRGEQLEKVKRTHCPQGHEYTPANTSISRRNQRKCRTCVNARATARKARAAIAAGREPHRMGRPPATHCPNGHPYDESNTDIYRGMRVCKRCRVLRNGHRRQRRAEARAARLVTAA